MGRLTGPALALVRHLIARPGETLPAAAGLYDYILAANGLYLRAVRAGLAVQILVAPCPVRGLAEVESGVRLTVPRVPAALTAQLLTLARAERDGRGRSIEVLYHLCFDDGGWQIVKPAQAQGRTFVEPAGEMRGSTYGRYLIEVHSHHELDFHDFSAIDDASERGTFRLFGLLTDIFRNPQLRLRLNVYDFSLDLPAALAFELPDGLTGPDPKANAAPLSVNDAEVFSDLLDRLFKGGFAK